MTSGPPAPEIAVFGAAADDENFAAGGDRTAYRLAVTAAETIDVELRYQPVGYRWAQNLAPYDAPEPAELCRLLQRTRALHIIGCLTRIANGRAFSLTCASSSSKTNRPLREMLAKSLREQAYAVDMAADSETALFQIGTTDYDAVVLDVKLPSADGFIVCRTIRQAGCAVPILMVTRV